MDLQNVGTEEDVTAVCARKDPFPNVEFETDWVDDLLLEFGEVIAWLFLGFALSAFCFLLLGIDYA